MISYAFVARTSFIVACGLLTACGSGANTADPNLSYRLQGDDISEVNVRADNYCLQHGKRAVLIQIRHVDGERLAVYTCEVS